MKQIHLIITGRVQGVGFRYWTRHIARRLGISGTVKNLEDGSVEVIAEGDEDELRVFRNAIKDGPPLANVTKITEEWTSPINVFEGFEILR